MTVESLPDEITIKRINKALSNPASGRWAQLLFGDATPRFRPESADFFVKHPSLDATLNDSQRKAVSLVVRAMDVAVIHGRECFVGAFPAIQPLTLACSSRDGEDDNFGQSDRDTPQRESFGEDFMLRPVQRCSELKHLKDVSIQASH